MFTCNNQTSTSQRIIGLTGGIAMGKTTVSNYLATVHHLPILDADVYARQSVEPGMSILISIVERYGSGILLPNGSLNRQRLGDIIFNSPAERLWVEQCIHPYVRDRLIEAISTPPLNEAERYPIVVMVIPLLFEARMTDLVTETWVVRCPTEHQLERLMQRDRLTLEHAQARINSQMAIQRKIACADVIVDNSSTINALYRQIDYYLAHQPNWVTVPRS
ncbi:MAG: dephospho-CoA kinase [Leptolyngbyaceae cyanobacterium RU_5_1]|nr:dephospho-CoA kinase [Leptolyngbyaceae cyanobacterium RU_5_1]